MPLDLNPKSQPVALLRWGAFRTGMLSNAAYQRVSGATSMQRAVSRLESYFATEAENWPVAFMFWQQMLMGCAVEARPTAAEVAGWNQIAQQTNMPISFNAEGYMEALIK